MKTDDKFRDPVVEVIHSVRTAMLEESGGDLRAMAKKVRQMVSQSGRTVRPAPSLPEARADASGN